MPRRRAPRPAGRGLAGHGQPSIERRRDGDWYVRRLSGVTSGKSYTCPGCRREVQPGTGHVVVWPVEKALLSADALDERRHWHTACWTRGA